MRLTNHQPLAPVSLSLVSLTLPFLHPNSTTAAAEAEGSWAGRNRQQISPDINSIYVAANLNGKLSSST
jgi:hypothetical protein